MKIAITGGRGQLGRELARVLEPAHEILIIDLPECDITQPSGIDRLVNYQPDLVIHAAAMTDVDTCARDPEAAHRANGLGTRNVAIACQRSNAAMLYISTNEVFDGEKGSAYLETDAPHPLNPYGASKLAGEKFAQELIPQLYLVRTAWLYACGGNKFPDKVIARAQTDGKLAYVDDEIGNPTYAPDLARAIAQLIETRAFGVYHFVNAGTASRYDWARRVVERAGLKVSVTRAKLKDYQRASTPPRNGTLANTRGAAIGIRLRNWEDALEEFFDPK